MAETTFVTGAVAEGTGALVLVVSPERVKKIAATTTSAAATSAASTNAVLAV